MPSTTSTENDDNRHDPPAVSHRKRGDTAPERERSGRSPAVWLRKPSLPEATDIMIAEHPAPPAGPRSRIVTNPSTLQPAGSVVVSDDLQWQATVCAAHAAAAAWLKRNTEERAALLAAVGERLLANHRELALLHTRESGQVLTESLDLVRRAAECWRIDPAAAMPRADSLPAVCMVSPRTDEALLDWSQIGADRLARGVTCVVASPSQTPLTLLRAAAACEGLPRGVLSMLVGEPAVPEGFSMECARPVDPPTASDIIYISRDADLKLAAAGTAALRLYHSGQRAEQSVRVYVERSLIYTFADRLHEYLAFLEAGDPGKPATDLGPLASAARLQEVETRVGRALKRGILIKLGGRRYQPWGLTGYFFQPTLMIEGTGEERAPDDQIRGPVIILTPARDLSEVLADRPDAGPVRVSLFAADVSRALATLSTDARRIKIDPVQSPGEDWFPYQARTAHR